MSIYKEGMMLAAKLEVQQSQIWPDSADRGVLVSKGDHNWGAAKQLAEWYGVPETREVNRYATGRSCGIDIELILNEHDGGNDRRMAWLEFVGFEKPVKRNGKDYEGYVSIWPKPKS